MIALSIQQPWADLIVRGLKDCENRTWRTDYRGPLLIHASRTLDKFARMKLEQRGFRFGQLPGGVILGAARMTDCLSWQEARSEWHEVDCFGFYLADAVKFEAPIPYTGRLGLFDVPEDVVREQLDASGFCELTRQSK